MYASPVHRGVAGATGVVEKRPAHPQVDTGWWEDGTQSEAEDKNGGVDSTVAYVRRPPDSRHLLYMPPT